MNKSILIIIMLLIPYISTTSSPLSVTTNKSEYAPGEKVTITVSGSPGTVVGIQVLKPNGVTNSVDQVTIGSNGKASTSFRLPDDNLGVWKVVATGGGEKAETTFKVKGTSSITISVDKKFIVLGESVTISGSIKPAVSTTVKIEYSKGGGWSTLRTVQASKGKYSFTWTPESEGSYSLRASWSGNDKYFGATSSVVSFTVSSKQRSTITLEVSPSEVNVGEKITVSGCLSPSIASTDILLIYTGPGERKIRKTVKTDSNGCFNDTFMPNASGSWSVKAVWSGNEDYLGSSKSVGFKVRNVLSLSLYLKANIVQIGDHVILYANISPQIEGLKIFFEYSSDRVNWTLLGSTYTNKEGVAALLVSLDKVGKYFIRAKTLATEEYSVSISNIVDLAVKTELKDIETIEKTLNETKSLLNKCQETVEKYEKLLSSLSMNTTELLEELVRLKSNLNKTMEELNNTKKELINLKSKLEESQKIINSMTFMQYIYAGLGFISGAIVGALLIYTRKRKKKQKVKANQNS